MSLSFVLYYCLLFVLIALSSSFQTTSGVACAPLHSSNNGRIPTVDSEPVSYGKPPLTFRATDNKFRILQFSDMHYGSDAAADAATTELQRKLLAAEQPDLVVLSGDQVSKHAARNADSCFANGTAACWDAAVRPMVEARCPWTAVLGNNDYVADWRPSDVLKLDAKYPLSYSGVLPANTPRGSNYVVTVPDRRTGDAALRVWHFDSGTNDCYGVKGYDCVTAEQVTWYRNTSRVLNAMNGARGRPVPAIAVIHIPIPEYLALWNDPSYDVVGTANESICCSSLNTGLFAAFKELGDVVLVTSGHDHGNDFVGEYEGVTLAYGRRTGRGGAGYDGGARVIEATLGDGGEVRIDTWIRDASGAKVVQTAPSSAQRRPYLKCCDGGAHADAGDMARRR